MSDKLNELLSKITPDNRHGEITINNPETVKVKRLHPDAILPTKAHSGDAGFDLYALEDVVIEPGETALIKTGLAFELPEGFELQIRPRSGITLKSKLRVNLGTVDSGYRAEVGVVVDNIYHEDCNDDEDFLYSPFDITSSVISNRGHYSYGSYIVRKGERIAQAVIQRLPSVELIEVDSLGDSDRGEEGFGSSGI